MNPLKPDRPNKRIALLGSAPSSVALAPFNDRSWTIWSCSPGATKHLQRTDAHFELHRYVPGHDWAHPDYIRWMADLKCHVFMQRKTPDIPNSVAYPKDQVLNYIYGEITGPDGQKRGLKFDPNTFGSSLSWMLALAIMQDPDEIGLWGVDMAACTSPETRVLRSDLKWVECKDLEVGDKIIAFDEEPVENGNSIKARRWREADVLEASRLTKPCYRIELEDGTEFVCSEDHMWLTYGENQARWKETRDLVTPHHRDGKPTRIIKLLDTWVDDKSWESGYLAAAFDGEGHISQKLRDGDYGILRLGFAQRDNEMADTVKAALKDRGFDLSLNSTHDGANGDVGKFSIKGGRAKALEFLGSIRPQRLLGKFNAEHLGKLQKRETVAVIKAEFIGEQPVIGLRTSTKTFIAEGFASHNTEEYGSQKDGCLSLIHAAKSIGIKITVPPESDLLRPAPLYGMCETDPMHIKLRSRGQEIEGLLAQARHDLANLEKRVAFFEGALDNHRYVYRTWVADPVALARAYEQPTREAPVIETSKDFDPPAIMPQDAVMTADDVEEIMKPAKARRKAKANGIDHEVA